MTGKSNIEWTEQTWNPIVGCSIVSPGCTNCYAMKMAARIQKINRTGGSGSNYVNHYDGTTKSVNGKPIWTGRLAMARDKLFLQPLSRKTPTTYFVNSMGDLFHEDCPDEWIDRVFAVMALCPRHTFQVLTKRATRMRETVQRIGRSINYLEKHARSFGRSLQWNVPSDLPSPLAGKTVGLIKWPLPNVWIGVSTERQQEADERIPLLLQTPAAVRFISAEPLLGPIDLSTHLGMAPNHDDLRGLLNWVIVGGESGHGYRPMDPAWAYGLREQCIAADVPVFVKQMAGKLPIPPDLLTRQYPLRVQQHH